VCLFVVPDALGKSSDHTTELINALRQLAFFLLFEKHPVIEALITV